MERQPQFGDIRQLFDATSRIKQSTEMGEDGSPTESKVDGRLRPWTWSRAAGAACRAAATTARPPRTP